MNMESLVPHESPNWSAPITLRGQIVSVIPLQVAHLRELQQATADGDLHRLWYTMVPDAASMQAEIERRLRLQTDGSMLPFSILDNTADQVVGMTTFMNIEQAHRRLEIGSTWYRQSAQRTALNTECKLLLLGYAFDSLDCLAVEFRTHAMNHASRRAIERLGAKIDGVLRSHRVLSNGSIRDTAVYSILANEWPAVRANLQWQLDKPRR